MQPDARRTVLKSGHKVLFRPLRPEDAMLLRNGLTLLSPASRYRRFLSARQGFTDEELAWLTRLDYQSRMAWLAIAPEENGQPAESRDSHQLHQQHKVTGTPEGIAFAIARYDATDKPGDANSPSCAEIALTITDPWQGRGAGTALLSLLGQSARANGIAFLEADTLPENQAMIALLNRAGARWSRSSGPLLHARLESRQAAALPF